MPSHNVGAVTEPLVCFDDTRTSFGGSSSESDGCGRILTAWKDFFRVIVTGGGVGVVAYCTSGDVGLLLDFRAECLDLTSSLNLLK